MSSRTGWRASRPHVSSTVTLENARAAENRLNDAFLCGLCSLAVFALCHQDAVEEPLQFARALGQFSIAGVGHVAAAKQLVGDIEGGQDRQPQRIAGRRRIGGGAELLVDVRRQAGDVPRDPACCGSGNAARGSRRG